MGNLIRLFWACMGKNAPWGSLNDWFAVISTGTYPTPTPTAAERAYYAATNGLRHSL